MSLKRIHVVVQGRVQGVFFRDYTSDEAHRLGLYGWVRNLPDGSVEAEFQGEERDVGRMLSWLHKGSPHSHVVNVVQTPVELINTEKIFVVRY